MRVSASAGASGRSRKLSTDVMAMGTTGAGRGGPDGQHPRRAASPGSVAPPLDPSTGSGAESRVWTRRLRDERKPRRPPMLTTTSRCDVTVISRSGHAGDSEARRDNSFRRSFPSTSYRAPKLGLRLVTDVQRIPAYLAHQQLLGLPLIARPDLRMKAWEKVALDFLGLYAAERWVVSTAHQLHSLTEATCCRGRAVALDAATRLSAQRASR